MKEKKNNSYLCCCRLQSQVQELQEQLSEALSNASLAAETLTVPVVPEEPVAPVVHAPLTGSEDPRILIDRMQKTEENNNKLKEKLKISMSNTEKLTAKLEEVKTAYKKSKDEMKQLKVTVLLLHACESSLNSLFHSRKSSRKPRNRLPV